MGLNIELFCGAWDEGMVIHQVRAACNLLNMILLLLLLFQLT